MKLDKTNWAATRLEDVAYWYQKDIPNSQQEAMGVQYYLTADHIDADAITIKRYSELSDGQKGPTITKHFEKGDLLFSTRSTALHKAAIAPVAGVTGEKLLVVRVKPDSQLIPELLPFVMQSAHFWDFAINSAAGSVNKFTSWTKIREYKFLLPPLDQQARLAELLWAADELEESQIRVKNQTSQYASLIVNEAFGSPKSIFKKYDYQALESCCVLQTGVAKGKKYSEQDVLVSVPYLRVANVQDGYVDTSEIKEIEISSREIKRYSLKAGDVLLTEGGDFDKLGRGAVWYAEIEQCLHQNHVFCVRPDQDKLLPEFVSVQTGSAYGKAYFLLNAKKTSNLASINSTQVKKFPMLVPSLKEQETFIGKVNRLKIEINKLNEGITQANNVKQAIINQIFLA